MISSTHTINALFIPESTVHFVAHAILWLVTEPKRKIKDTLRLLREGLNESLCAFVQLLVLTGAVTAF